MQLSGVPRRNPGPSFANHTPRAWEITAMNPSQFPTSSDMFGPTGMTVGSGSIMGQGSSKTQRVHMRDDSSTIFRQNSIQQTEAGSQYTLPLSETDGASSSHYHCTSQAHYFNHSIDARPTDGIANDNDKMMTQTSLSRLPRENASHDLAFFLRTTGPSGPTVPHRKPSRIENSRRTLSAPKKLRFFNLSGVPRRQVTPAQAAHERLNGVLRDEGGLLVEPLPPGVQQKVSSTGKRYLAVQGPSAGQSLSSVARPDILSPEVLESQVSVWFHDDINASDVLDSWLSTLSRQQHSIDDNQKSIFHTPPRARTYEEVAHRLSRQFPTPVRPAASNPPSPIAESTLSKADSDRTGLDTHSTSRPPYDTSRALSSHPITSVVTHPPKISLPYEESPVRHPGQEKEVEIKHPVPRRMGSHPVLLHRSSVASSMYQGSTSDSPGPPPPKSPLRLKREHRTIEGMVNNNGRATPTPRMAPSIKSVGDFHYEPDITRATVTTECTGPIKRPKSRNGDVVQGYPATRREREERLRVRKLKERPSFNRTIDSVVNAPTSATRHRLRKMRPHIQIPDFRPTPLRAPSAASMVSASSTSSWLKHTQSTIGPVSPVPSLASEFSEDDRSPISTRAGSLRSTVRRSPMMLVAEEVSIPKTKCTPKPAKLILKDGRSFAPRPRSASIGRTAARRKSRTSNSIHSSIRSKSPFTVREEETPPLPSPAPTRALPPTPPASGSEKSKKSKSTDDARKELPTLPSYEVSPIESTSSKQRTPHITSPRQSNSTRESTRSDPRLEALEKQNALLSAALMAVLKTNGSLNGPVPGTPVAEVAEASEPPRAPMGWELRVAKRSAAGHKPTSSDGSALDMYLNTRQSNGYGR